MKRFCLTAATIAACSLSSLANAATVTFNGSADGTDFAITIDDNTAGQINFAVTASANPISADLFGLGFDWASLVAPEESDFHFVSSNTGAGITDVCLNRSRCGGGLNFNGPGETFDYIVRMGDQGTQGGNYLTDFAFYVTTALSLDDILGDTFGIRAQSSGSNRKGSIKLVNFTVSQVPLPAAGWLLFGSFGALAMMRRRKKS